MNRTLLFLLVVAATALGEELYIKESATGTGSGNSAANAAAYTFFNTAGNWDTVVNTTNGKIGPGDTVHIVGVITNQLVFQGSGTPGNRITLKFDAGGKLRHPTSSATGMITAGNGLHDVTIEGGNPGPVKTSTTQMDIEIFQNGTAFPGSINNGRGIFIDNAFSNITIKNLFIWGMYVRTYGSADLGTSQNGITLRGDDDLVVDNVCVQHGEGGVGITGLYTSNDRLTVKNCLILDTSTAIKFGIGGNNNLTNLDGRVTDNRLDGFGRWSGIPPNGHHHHDGVQTITVWEKGDRMENLHVAYNEIGPDIGTDGAMNAPIYLEASNNGTKCYNNLILNTLPGRRTSNKQITNGTQQIFFGQPFYKPSYNSNNTFVGHTGTTATTGVGEGPMSMAYGKIFGCVIFQCNNWTKVGRDDTVEVNTLNYSVYHGAIESAFGVAWGPSTGVKSTAAWQALGYDVNSVFADPQINANGTLKATSPAIDLIPPAVVAELSAFYTDDFNHNPRTGPNWDAGAFEFSSGGPVAPTVVSSAINTVGNQFSMVMSEASVFGAGGTGGISVTSTGGTVTLETTPSISGSTITWDITNRLIGQTETLTRTYTQPGNGIEASDDGLDISSFSGVFVTNNSTVAQAAMPQFSPPEGGYTSTQNVVISSTTPSNTIRYTVNGTDPTSTSTLYTGPIATSVTTMYKARAFASGFFDSLVGSANYQIGDLVITNSWFNSPIAAQTGAFVWAFRAATATAPNDAVVGLADGTVSGYSNLATIIRFNSSGFIDAYNGTAGNYTALSSFPYVAGQTYDFVVTVNVPAHTYSVTVVQTGGGTPTDIVTNVAFRSPSSGVTELDNLGAIAVGGALTISNMSISAVPSTGTPIETINVNNLRIGP